MTYLDFPKMLGNFWRRPVNVYEQDGTGGEDDHPAEDVVSGGSILKDLLLWFLWVALSLALLGLVLLIPGWISGGA